MLYHHGLLVKRLAAALMPCRTWLMMYRKVSVCLTGTCFSALLAYMCNTKPCANSCRLVSRLPVGAGLQKLSAPVRLEHKCHDNN